MRPALSTLKLVLDEVGVPPDIGTLGERKRIQKAVYLAQAAGAPLGYSYGWYLRGPYSPRLTRDYFALDEGLSSGEEEGDLLLRPSVRERLATVQPLFTVPDGVDLQDPEWLELLASICYLQQERGLAPDKADEVIAKEKAGLRAYVDHARAALEEVGLP